MTKWPIQLAVSLVLVELLGLGSQVRAEEAGATLGTVLGSDSEGFHTRRLLVEVLPWYATRDRFAGIRLATTNYAAMDWRRDAHQISAIYRSFDPVSANGTQAETGWSRQGGRGLLTIDASYRSALDKAGSLELFLNRDWVETRGSLDKGVSYTFAGGAYEQALGPHLTAVGVLGAQRFSDGNWRQHGRAKLIVQPDLDLGLTLQARYRVFHSNVDVASGSYFNPGRYHEAMLAVGWRQRRQGWMGSVTAGMGRQLIDGGQRTPTRLLELAIESPPSGRQSVRASAGLNTSASYGGPEYSYRYLQARWTIGF